LLSNIFMPITNTTMKISELKSLIREALQETLTDQSFENLRSNVSSRTQLGEKWNKLVWSLEGIYEEVKDFEGMYTSTISKEGKPANIQETLRRVEQIVALATSIKPSIISMDVIQRKDMAS